MTRIELENKLIELNINPSAYTLDGGLWDDRYVLNKESGGNWSVYYSERSDRIGYRIFASESEACEYFFKKIVSDPSTRR